LKRNFDEYPKIKAWFEKVGAIKEIKEIQVEWTKATAELSEILTK